MRKKLPVLLLLLTSCLISISSFAQSVTIKGSVKGTSTGEALPAVSVTVKGSSAGVYTNDKGEFSITVPSLPVTLVISSVNFETKEVTVASASQQVEVSLTSSSPQMGEEIVVSATRVAIRKIESPVTIEQVSAANIRNSPASTFYEVVQNLKGVDMLTSSLTFKTPTTRGFNGSGNTRFNQITDGMDNQAPGLNFSVGSIIGLSELDVDNMELLPGASSALYGPGGMNGTLLINSKSPFKYQGFSFQIKQGIMHADRKYRQEVSPYYNWNLRWAEKIGERAAFKITSEFIQAKDWLAADQRNYKRLGTTGNLIPGTRTTDPNYDGVNVYGDETTFDLVPFLQGIGGQAPFLAPYINTLTGSPINVSRTGYAERDLVDPNTVNFKLGGAFHYKITDDLEAIAMGYIGSGNSVYTASDRYSFKNFIIKQYKLELKAKNWFIRGWATQEDAGESYNATVTTRLTNEAIRKTVTFTNGQPTPQLTDWAVIYSQAFLAGKLSGLTDIDAHNNARSVSDAGAPKPGTDQFKQIFDRVRSVPISKGGGLFIEKSDLYVAEGQYNFSHLTGNVVDILVGGDFRRFVLDSEGTLFADSAAPIPINQFGGYAQVSKKLLKDRLNLTVSGRYDKNENFDGRFTPRATALIKVNKNNSIRLSYQTAYRFPSTQQQWINLRVGGDVLLIGGVTELRDYYKFNSNPIYSLESVQAGAPKVYDYKALKPENVTSYELGYKGVVADNKLLIDVYGYYGQYENFLARTLVVQSKTGNISGLNSASTRQVYSVPVNTEAKVKTYGYGLGLEYKLPGNFVVTVNGSSDVLQDIPPGYVAFFNSPKYRANVIVGNNQLGKRKNIGFNIAYRWQDSYFFEGDFANGEVPAIQTLDAQFSYKIPKTKSLFKLGANNLLNQYYYHAPGNPSVGGLYYVSYSYNIF
ncbi:TonB-dependent receptor [Lacibacter sediminis]|uniref:TonB-dependent receptor n=1 Tax=Lacibacter sediminis TaxID=2760713 RepID=A0A7G5XMD8_9BACT|nr:TonB-dependent receptor [Lacibacter sediminis]QNA46641.1 TonB-dependent receptor [Lacibacter sediminis]